MESEEIITKIISERQILKQKQIKFASNPNYNLGSFIQNYKPEPNPYDERFLFIK